ncbi:MAG: TerB family tellurite resistance protein [Deltaproteobacteria bacterium]|nr:TerB family tellurite resistance protein [Deltaproteobacteria bacterium]
MSLFRFLRMKEAPQQDREAGDTESVRRIAAKLERLDPPRAKYLAAFAYVLARVANADLEIDAAETTEIERSLAAISDLSESEIALAVEIAKSQARLLGGTENYVVTREFRENSTPEQRGQMLQCLYAVVAADGSISSIESSEIVGIAEELGFSRMEANALKSQYREKLSVLKTKS